MIARVLIAQNSDHPPAAEKPDRLMEAFASVEKLHPEACPLLPDELVETATAQSLINRAQPFVTKMVG